jgi:hypothetical protein
MRSVLINCAQTVFNTPQKSVGTGAQFIHSVSTFFTKRRVVHKTVELYMGFVRAVHTYLYTRKNRFFDLLIAWFYPLSTPPTITTTIYINRRGAAK